MNPSRLHCDRGALRLGSALPSMSNQHRRFRGVCPPYPCCTWPAQRSKQPKLQVSREAFTEWSPGFLGRPPPLVSLSTASPGGQTISLSLSSSESVCPPLSTCPRRMYAASIRESVGSYQGDTVSLLFSQSGFGGSGTRGDGEWGPCGTERHSVYPVCPRNCGGEVEGEAWIPYHFITGHYPAPRAALAVKFCHVTALCPHPQPPFVRLCLESEKQKTRRLGLWPVFPDLGIIKDQAAWNYHCPTP